jgi:hypothetical protein
MCHAVRKTGRKQHAPAGLYALAETTYLDDFAGDAASQDKRHGELIPGMPARTKRSR